MKTLVQWLIEKTNTEAYRAGRMTGWKHPKVDRRLIEAAGGMKKLIAQAVSLEKDPLFGGLDRFRVTWTNLGSDMEKIEYDISILPELCKREGIKDPREAQLEKIEQIKKYREKVYSYPWILPYYDSLLDRLERGKEVPEAEEEELFSCLNAVIRQETFIFERVFSARPDVLNDSKAFQKKYKQRIFTILKSYSPHYVEGMTIDELFAAHEIHSYAQTLEWKGSLVYRIDQSVRVDSSCNRYGTVLNAQTLEHSMPEEMRGCKTVMIIENKATYENMAYREDTLYIYCHGFFSPKEVRFLKEINKLADPDCGFYHWGDMDYGGINIFLYNKTKIFPKLMPYKMSREDFFQAVKAGAGLDLEETTKEKLMKMDAGLLTDLKEAILEAGKTIEQEKIGGTVWQ